VSTSSGIVISSTVQHFWATSTRSCVVRGWTMEMPALSLEAIRQPSVGWASRM
jgi:hypothetical protein